MTGTDAIAEELWAFANAFYDLPGVATVCLTLQDDYDADVVLLISLLWMARHQGRAAETLEIARFEAALSPWRVAVIEPLRALRRDLKPQLRHLPERAAETRERIKAAELQAERVAFDLLAAEIGDLMPREGGLTSKSSVRQTLETYFGALGHANGPELEQQIAYLLQALRDDNLDS